MARHIHIHIHRRPARDAGFDEGKHKRDEGGKFSAGHSAIPHDNPTTNKLNQQTHERIQSGQPARNAAEAERYRQHRNANHKVATEADVKAHPAYKGNEHHVEEAKKQGFSAAGQLSKLDYLHRTKPAAQTPKAAPPKSEPIPGGHRVTYTEEHHHALKDVLPPARAQALAKSGTTNLSYEQHEQMMKRHFS